MCVTSFPLRTDNVKAGKLALEGHKSFRVGDDESAIVFTHVLDEDNRARNEPSMPRSISNASASTPDMEGWNHLQGNDLEETFH